MFAVVYRWRLRPGMETQFVDGWARVTRAIHDQCGSLGSRLHEDDDGTWVAYACWPDEETRSGCDFDEPEGSRMMADSVLERYPESRLQVAYDLLDQ